MRPRSVRRALSIGGQFGPPATNEYYETALALAGNIVSTSDSHDFGAMPDIVRSYETRGELTRKYAWAIPNDEALDAIASLGRIVEIGAGTGYWANQIASRGADVVAYDIKPGNNHWVEVSACYHTVSVGNWRKVMSHQDRALMLCWPPMSRMADKNLRAYTGDRLVYIGESDGGCTADERFFRQIDSEWDLEREVCIPQWYGLHDYLWIYARRSRA